LSRLWYRLGRAGIEIPFPQRVVTLREATQRSVPRGAVLKALELFAPFTEAERDAIAASARERRFGTGEAVVTEGARGETFYAVLLGSLSVRVGKPGKEVAKLLRGDGFGEMSLLTDEPRAATVVALEDCVLLELDRTAFAEHFAEHPGTCQQLWDSRCLN